MKSLLAFLIVLLAASSSCTKKPKIHPNLAGNYCGVLYKDIYYLSPRPSYFAVDSIIMDTLTIELMQNEPTQYFINFNRGKGAYENAPNNYYNVYENEAKSNQDSLVLDYDYRRDKNHWYGINYNKCSFIFYYKTGKVRFEADYSNQDAYFSYYFLES